MHSCRALRHTRAYNSCKRLSHKISFITNNRLVTSSRWRWGLIMSGSLPVNEFLQSSAPPTCITYTPHSTLAVLEKGHIPVASLLPQLKGTHSFTIDLRSGKHTLYRLVLFEYGKFSSKSLVVAYSCCQKVMTEF